MGTKRNNKGNPFSGKIPSPAEPSVDVSLKKLQVISIDLKYYHSKSECFSDWQKDELKKFSRFLNKVQGMTWTQICADGGLSYCNHKGPASRGFTRPSGLSLDVNLCELRVDGKARVHGFQDSSSFYLIWLDRGHAVFPSGK